MGARGLAIGDALDAAARRRFAQTEPDRRAALRALAIAQALDGTRRAEAARGVGRERQALRAAVVRYNAEGLAGLHDRARLRRRETLDAGQPEARRAWVLQGPEPEAAGISSDRLLDIAARIAACWGVRATLSALSRRLRRTGRSWQKARPAHLKGSTEARELYKNPRARAAVLAWHDAFATVGATPDILRDAVELAAQNQLGRRDSAILAAAISSPRIGSPGSRGAASPWLIRLRRAGSPHARSALAARCEAPA